MAQGWKAFRRLASEERFWFSVDIPPLEAKRFDTLQLIVKPNDGVLLVCEKLGAKQYVEAWQGRSESVAFECNTATAYVPPSMTTWAARTLQTTARTHGMKLAYLGDVDPESIFQYAALRAGGHAALLAGKGPRLDVEWVLDDRMVGRIFAEAGEKTFSGPRTLELGWLRQEYWELVKRFVPDAKQVIGSRSFRMLDHGHRLEVDALLHEDDYALRPVLRTKLLRMIRTQSAESRDAHTTRRS